ncbi:hypothetical protein C8F04DRAFT_408661 [Mycena alexandri]|uniref:Uncharacterized protein n=1 Tax=Mycena alexandri TaxID=1745969 RepID=A0AAD6WNL0_9AGAR|nr:hypothetical protein C8F04DRAFT_408661 [Mycena alexandri]
MAASSKPASAASAPAPESTASSILRIPTEKISSLIRMTSTQRKRPPIIFPPPSWQLEETQNNGAGASDLPDEPGIPKNISDDGVLAEDAPEPHMFAQRIGTLIDSLPPPEPTKDADVGEVDPKGPPLPLSVTSDSKLMKLLASENVMNGSISAGRQSVWSMLERLERLTGRHGADGASKKAGEGKGDEREDGGVMMYAPLQPTADSQVELADSEMVLEYFDEPTEQEKSNKASEPPSKDTTKPPLTRPQPGSRKSDGVQPSKSRSKQRVKEHVHWVPSPTQISLQANWWGYRLYLPPPVMNLLDDTRLAAARRGAMITAALKYLLDKIPLMLLPPQVRPAVMVLKRLTPYLGYVGVFIAWSWTAIKARDKGDGVVLTATWLLPVALVPATLNADDFQRRPVGGINTPTPKGVPTDTSSAKSDPTPKADAGTKAPAAKADLKPGDSKKATGDSKKAGDAETESLARRWTTALRGHEKSKETEAGK